MNNRGQVVFYTLMIGIVIIIIGLALAPVVQDFITDARNETTGMDCDNSSISDFDKAGCITSDLTLFYFIAGLIFLGGAVIAARKFI